MKTSTKSLTSFGRQRSFSKSHDKSEGSCSSADEHLKKLSVVVNEATSLTDVDNEHYLEISLDCSDKIHLAKPLSGHVLKWNKKFSFHYILAEEVKIKFTLKTSTGDKAVCEVPFASVNAGKTEKAKKFMTTPSGANYCTLYYEITFEDESKAKSKEYRRLSQSSSSRLRPLDSLSRDSEDRSGTGSGPGGVGTGTGTGPKGSPIKNSKPSASYRNSNSANESPSLNNSSSNINTLRVNSNNNNDQETKSKSSVEETATGLYSPLDFIQPEVKQTELDNAFTERNCVINCAADYVYKIIIVGDSGVGKSCLMRRWVYMEFQNTTTTVCVETQVKSYDVNGEIVSFQIWDTAGQEKFRAITTSYYRGAHGVIIVYDITNYKSFDSISRWLQDVESHSSHEAPPKILLIGNKSDVVASRTVSVQKGKALAQSQDLYFMETSALTGNQVQQAVQILLQEIHKNKDIYSKMEKSPVVQQTTQDPSVKIRRVGRSNDSDRNQELVPSETTCC